MDIIIKSAKFTSDIEEYIIEQCREFCHNIDCDFEKYFFDFNIEKLPDPKSEILNDILIELKLIVDFDLETFSIIKTSISFNNQSSIDIDFTSNFYDNHKLKKHETYNNYINNL